MICSSCSAKLSNSGCPNCGLLYDVRDPRCGRTPSLGVVSSQTDPQVSAWGFFGKYSFRRILFWLSIGFFYLVIAYAWRHL
jgi:predicted amidophosphoribosyltransferase